MREAIKSAAPLACPRVEGVLDGKVSKTLQKVLRPGPRIPPGPRTPDHPGAEWPRKEGQKNLKKQGVFSKNRLPGRLGASWGRLVASWGLFLAFFRPLGTDFWHFRLLEPFFGPSEATFWLKLF